MFGADVEKGALDEMETEEEDGMYHIQSTTVQRSLHALEYKKIDSGKCLPDEFT